jgi:hypothetical protein
MYVASSSAVTIPLGVFAASVNRWPTEPEVGEMRLNLDQLRMQHGLPRNDLAVRVDSIAVDDERRAGGKGDAYFVKAKR